MPPKEIDRYKISENESYEPGSNDCVLKNSFEITSKAIMDQIEARELERATLSALWQFDESHRFRVSDICALHALWLGEVYPFAGQFRSVNMAKSNFRFAASNRIAYCMEKFEQEFLAKYTPCHDMKLDELTYALAVIHVEFILIHPFREGNGRIGRLLAVLMALQAKQPLLIFDEIDQTANPQGFKDYIVAIHAGVGCDYLPMQLIFERILEGSVLQTA